MVSGLCTGLTERFASSSGVLGSVRSFLERQKTKHQADCLFELW